MQAWRVPVFERISKLPAVDNFCVFHGSDFPGTKVVSYKGEKDFRSKAMPTLRFKLKVRNRRICQAVNLTFFFELIRYKPDVILCEGASNLFNATVAFVYAALFRKRFVWWSLGELKNRKKTIYRKILEAPIQFMERHSDGIISYSSLGAEYFKRVGVDPTKIFVAVNVIDTDKKKAVVATLDTDEIYRKAHENSDFNLIFVGAITEEKRLDVLLRAFSEFEQKSTRSKLTIVGDGEHYEACKALANELKLKNIEFTGRVVDGVSNYFLGADLFVLPGLGGLAVSDALVHGLPVVASIADGCEKDLLGSGAGIIDEDLNVESLVEHLTALYNDRARLLKMKEEAIRVVDSVYNIQTYMDRIEECLLSLSPRK
jgi:glycosyltransferase involved in cell wall biosynthesis